MDTERISYAGALRTSLNALEDTNRRINREEERLASASKLNSILDNPANFFYARRLDHTADLLTTQIDGIQEAIQTIKAANHGISAIRSMLSNLRALAGEAMKQNAGDVRRELGDQYNAILQQASEIAEDSAYNTTNLLVGGTKMRVTFGSNLRISRLDVKGLNILAGAGGGVSNVQVSSIATRSSLASSGTISAIASQAEYRSVSSMASAGTAAFVASQASQASVASVGTRASQGTVASSGSQVSQASRGTTTSSASQSSLSSASAILSQSSQGTLASIASQASLSSRTSSASGGTSASVAISFTQRFAFGVEYTAGESTTAVGLRKHGESAENVVGDHRVDFGASNYRDVLWSLKKEIDQVDSALIIQAGRFSTSIDVLNQRESFSKDMILSHRQQISNVSTVEYDDTAANLASLRVKQRIALQSVVLSANTTRSALRLLA